MSLARLAVASLAVLAAACGGDDIDDDDTPAACRGLDATNTKLLFSEPDSTQKDIAEGDTVPLIRPVQGGQIVLAGARVQTDVDCDYTAVGTVTDTGNDQLLGRTEQTLTLHPTPDGWARPEPGLITLLMIPVCPSSAASGRIDGAPQRLDVSLATLSGTPLMAMSATIVPTCPNTDCMHECMPVTP